LKKAIGKEIDNKKTQNNVQSDSNNPR